jgi:hypothetical protein
MRTDVRYPTPMNKQDTKTSAQVSKIFSWVRSRNGYGPLPAADCTTATVLLLLFHLPEHGILLDLDQIAALVLAQTKPELFDTLTLLCRASTPDLGVVLRGFTWSSGSRRAMFLWHGCIG